MLLKKSLEILKKREFVNVATCDFSGRPNAAPKLILRIDDNVIYLIDYTIGRTWTNLKLNPQASLSFMDQDALTGYQLNCSVELLESGDVYEKLVHELREKEIDLSAKRVIEGVLRGKKHDDFELAISEKFVIFKVNVNEAVSIGLRSGIKREQVK